MVPRLEIDLNLVAAFPPPVADPLRRSMLDAEAAQPTLVTRSLLVDVFYQPQLVQHAVQIVERRRAGLTYKAIAEELGLTKYHMENCASVCQMMEEQGLAEPYFRLTEKPDKVSKWCSKHWLKAGHLKTSGRRRAS